MYEGLNNDGYLFKKKKKKKKTNKGKSFNKFDYTQETQIC